MNAVAELLRQKLSVPNIYLQPESEEIAADVLAVDRAGAGDLHAVEIKLPEYFQPKTGPNPRSSKTLNEMNSQWMRRLRKRISELREQLMRLPAHYKYVAIPTPQISFELVLGELGQHLYSPDGIGRIGIITIAEKGENPPVAEMRITPERFRVDSTKLKKIEKTILEKVRPDIAVRI